jgi:hypothetical protein
MIQRSGDAEHSLGITVRGATPARGTAMATESLRSINAAEPRQAVPSRIGSSGTGVIGIRRDGHQANVVWCELSTAQPEPASCRVAET